MNNFKKLLAVVIVVTMLVTAMIPVMAADSFSYEDEAQVLADLGLMIGDGQDLDLDGELTREMGAVLLVRLLGAEEDALDLTDAEIAAALEDYTDKDDISFWAEAYVAYATDAGYLAGRDDGSLDPKANLLGKDYATMILRAMGYEVDAEGWAIATTLLAEVDGLSVAQAIKFNDKALIRDDAAGITYAALLGETADEETLIAALVAAGAVDADDAAAAGLYTKPAAADVKDITISNLKEVVVTFTAPVNATEAAKVANYTVATVAPSAVAVAADGKSVTLTAASSFTNYSSYAIVVKAAVGIPADVTKTVKAVDVTVPTLVAVAPTGPKSLNLTFSEPLKAATANDIVNAIKLDNATIAVSAVDVAAGAKVITIKTYVDLAVGSHTLDIKGSDGAGTVYLADIAGYTVQNASIVFDYVKDTTPLTYSVGASTETSVKIIFNKSIATLGSAYIRHTYDNSSYQAAADKVTLSADGKTLTAVFAEDRPLPPGTTTVYVGYSDTTKKITDGYGNTIDAFSFSVTTSPDMVKPTVTAVEFVSATSVKVTFSESVASATALDIANYTLKDSSKTYTISGAAFAKDSSAKDILNQVVLTTAQMNGGSYTLEVKKVNDLSIAKNVIDTVVIPFTGADKVQPDFADPAVSRLTSLKVRVNFNEAMDVATITNKLAYKVANGETVYALTADDTVVAAADSKSAIITFKNAIPGDTLILATATFKDIAGNMMTTYQATKSIPTDIATITGTAAITSKNTIVVTINDLVTNLTVSDFVYTKGGVDYAPQSIGVTQDATKTYVTLYYADSINATTTDDAGLTVNSTGTGKVLANVKNAYGTQVKFDAVDVTDKFAPIMISAARGIVAKTFTVTFSEALYAGSVYDTDFTVEGYTVTGVSLDGSVVTITVKEDIVAGATPVITIVGSVEDTLRNATTSGTKKVAE